jgi:hypothetical protein
VQAVVNEDSNKDTSIEVESDEGDEAIFVNESFLSNDLTNLKDELVKEDFQKKL